MRLTYEILRYELGEHFGCELGGCNKGCAPIGSPMVYEPGMMLAPDYCYLSDSVPSDGIMSAMNTLFIICSGTSEEQVRGFHQSTLVFPNMPPLLHVLNVLQEIFVKYGRWETGMRKLIQESGVFFSILEISPEQEADLFNAILASSYPIFGNPIFLADAGFDQIASVLPTGYPDPSPLADDMVVKAKDAFFKVRNLRQPYDVHLPDDYPRLQQNLIDNEEFLGLISVEGSQQPIREFDGYLLTALTNNLWGLMVRFSRIHDMRHGLIESMLFEIVKGATVNAEEFEHVALRAGIGDDEQFRVLTVRVPTPTGREYVQYFLRHLGTKIPSIAIATDESLGTVLLRVSKAEDAGIAVDSILEERLRSFGFRAGVSDRYTDLLDSAQYFRQAEAALRVGETRQGEEHAFLFSDCSLDFILSNCAGTLMPTMLLTEGFRKIVEHDFAGKVSYIETLRAYLESGLNMTQAAHALNISRNSFLSRFERIVTTLTEQDEDIDDPDEQFRLHLSLLLYDHLQGMRKKSTPH